MSRLRQIMALLAAATVFAVPATALAGPVLPPGNSAVNQYTQTFPTQAGNVSVKRNSIQAPKQVLGVDNTRKLDRQGAEGRAAAELAAATSPSSEGADAGGPEKEGEGDSRAEQRGQGAGGGGGGSGGGSGGSAAVGTASGGEGASGLGSVLAQATGSSSEGGLGLLMPFALMAGLVWCVAYSWRRRQAA